MYQQQRPLRGTYFVVYEIHILAPVPKTFIFVIDCIRIYLEKSLYFYLRLLILATLFKNIIYGGGCVVPIEASLRRRQSVPF